jgi:Kef-type K+ transport system membrane component KefB
MEPFLENFAHEFQTPFTNSVLIFSLILFIILLVPVIFNRFKIPGIIGLILSGIVIGPHGLHLIRDNSAVDLFSTIGLLYIMFIAGLELDLVEFRKNRNKSIVFGLFTFLIPISIGLPVCLFVLGYGFNTSLLTASMFATHTLIAYPIVNRLGISKNQAVAIAVGGTILTDTAVLLLLAIISGSVESGLTNDFWTVLIFSVVIFVGIVVFIVPKISSWFFRRLEDEKYAHFIYVLSIVFLCAFIAELAGLEPIIGAFAAGLVLNRLIPHTSSLMNRIEFVGNSLFIPFFLISVGMIIDVKVLVSGPQAIIVAGVLTIVAILGKWLAAQATGFIYKYSSDEKNLIFGLSSAHAAATLAVILVGYKIHLIDDNILNGTIILILITCVVASFVTERAGKNLLIRSDQEPEKIVEEQRILVPIANPQTMEKLIDFAAMIRNPSDRSPIVALSVVKDDDQAQQKLLQSRKLLEKVTIHAASSDQKIEITSTIDRNVANGIRRIAKEKFITDLVLGWSEERSIADIIFGKTFDGLVKQTSQNIFITRFVSPLNIQNRILLICPVFAEKEVGFYKWLASVMRLSSQLTAAIHLYATSESHHDIMKYYRSGKFSVKIEYKGVMDLGQVSKVVSVQHSDMIILVTSREGGISYSPALDVLPRKLAKQFPQNNVVFVYPETAASNLIQNYEQEVTGGILEKGMGIVQKATRFFKKAK